MLTAPLLHSAGPLWIAWAALHQTGFGAAKALHLAPPAVEEGVLDGGGHVIGGFAADLHRQHWVFVLMGP